MRHGRFLPLVLLLLFSTIAHGAFKADTWMPGPIEFSLGNVNKNIDPRDGGPCDQRCRITRIYGRLNAWVEAINYLQDIAPNDPEIARQLSCSQGLCFVLGEIQHENLCQGFNGCILPDGSRPVVWPADGRTSQKKGLWSESPDYDFEGNVRPRMLQLRARIVKLVNTMHLQPPAESVMLAFDIGRTAKGALTDGGNVQVAMAKPTMLSGPCVKGMCKTGRKACVEDNDCKFVSSVKQLGTLDTGDGCTALTPTQDDLLTRLLMSHHDNGEYRKAHNGQPRPGGAAEFFSLAAQLEASATSIEQQMEFLVFPFPNIERTTRPQWQRDALEDLVHEHMVNWATHIRQCPADPIYHLTAVWDEMHLHRDYHVFLATDFGGLLPLRLPCWPDKKAGISLASALTLDGCPNVAFPPPGWNSSPFMGTGPSPTEPVASLTSGMLAVAHAGPAYRVMTVAATTPAHGSCWQLYGAYAPG
mgnify:FL=1